MLKSKIVKYVLVILTFAPVQILSRDVILEFKGAYFHGTSSRFKKIYSGGALFGPELTVQFCDCSNWYGFLSVDYLSKNGHSIGLQSPTRVTLLPIGIGVKYFTQFTCWECADFYIGLGFQPLRVHTHDKSGFVIPKLTKWGMGGIVKTGAYIDLSGNFLLDIFVDYSFARVKNHETQAPTGPVIPLNASVNGVIFGAGLGYRF